MTLWRFIRRLVITGLAAVIIVIGIILLVIPGPGLVVIALGILLLSAEYPWAQRLVGWARDKLDRRRNKPAS